MVWCYLRLFPCTKITAMLHACSRFHFGRHWPHLIVLCFTNGTNRGSGVAVLRSQAEAGLALSFLFCCTQAALGFRCSDGVTRVQGNFVAPQRGGGSQVQGWRLSSPPPLSLGPHGFSFCFILLSAEWFSVLNYPKVHHQQ